MASAQRPLWRMASAHAEEPGTAQVIDLMDALRASLGKKAATAKPALVQPAAAPAAEIIKERKGAKRAAAPKTQTAADSAAAPAPARARK